MRRCRLLRGGRQRRSRCPACEGRSPRRRHHFGSRAAARERGGGYGFSFRTPDGQPLSISAGVAQHDKTIVDLSRPKNLTHVVINSANVGQQLSFFRDVLGFCLSDTTDMMEFIRCGTDHHSVAIARSEGPSLNHMAFEMEDIDGLMLGSGRLRRSGFEIE
jgi:hypothetical protein